MFDTFMSCFFHGLFFFCERCFHEVHSMAQNDRWTLKILALPIFTDDFAQAILATPLANLAFVIATDAGSGTAFADQVASWAHRGKSG